MMAALLPGYRDSLSSIESRKRYSDKIKLADGIDPYEVKKNEWQDNVDLCPGISHVDVCMYLILTPSPYSEEDMLNYKSLDSYQNFAKDDDIENAASDDKHFCLQKESDGMMKLKTDHQYYYQVQAQLFCTGLSYCDLVVYTNKDLHVERIKQDCSFMEENLRKVKDFFEIAVFPELLGRWFSRPPERIPRNSEALSDCTNLPAQLSSSDSCGPSSDESNSTATCTLSANEAFCYCQQGEHGEMVGCDNPNCMYQWFHLECLFPRSRKWYFPDCRKLKHNQ